MTAPKSVDPARFLREQLDSASPDLLREMVKTFADALMSASGWSRRTGHESALCNGKVEVPDASCVSPFERASPRCRLLQGGWRGPGVVR